MDEEIKLPEIKKINRNWLLIGLMIVAIGLSLWAIWQPKDAGKYDYCVEWANGKLTRDSVLYNCFNFVEGKVVCDWIIDPTTNNLVVMDWQNRSNILAVMPCTRMIKSINISVEG